MSTPKFPIAPGRSDLEMSLLAEDLLNIITDILETKLLGIVSNGRVLSTSISGQIGHSQGGTGNTLGQTVPLDGSVTDVKVAVGADIDPAKLDQTLLRALAYLLVKDYLVAGADISITPDDILHTLTVAYIGLHGIETLNSDGTVDLAERLSLRFADGWVATDGPEGAIYYPSVRESGGILETVTPVLDSLGNPVLDSFGNTVLTYAAVHTLGVNKYSSNVGDGSSTTITITHSLGTTDVILQVREVASPYTFVYPDMRVVDANNVALDFTVAPAVDEYRVVVMG